MQKQHCSITKNVLDSSGVKDVSFTMLRCRFSEASPITLCAYVPKGHGTLYKKVLDLGTVKSSLSSEDAYCTKAVFLGVSAARSLNDEVGRVVGAAYAVLHLTVLNQLS